LDGFSFDVAVIGAGINGASAAQHLAAAGYAVLIIDKGDFASGSTGRSTRLLHCGLRYLDRGEPMWRFLVRPDNLSLSVRRAREFMAARSELAATIPDRVAPFTAFVPVWAGDHYAPWQVSLALKLLAFLGPSDPPLDGRRHRIDDLPSRPLLRWLRDPGELRALYSFREYRYDWPERIAVDCVLDAERLGAEVRNYTEVVSLDATGSGAWSLGLRDATGSATVVAATVLNTAGVWVDRVNRLAAPSAKARIAGTKGAHIVVKLPDECRDLAIATFNRLGMPAYLVPWRHVHHFGPTETHFEGDVDDVRVTQEEVEFLLDELDHLLPGAGVTGKHLLNVWAGVRPLTNSDQPNRKHTLIPVIHDMAQDGMPGVLGLTGSPIVNHRQVARRITEAVRARIPPSRPAQPPAYRNTFIPGRDAPPLTNDDPAITLGDLRHSAQHEHCMTLADLLLRRTGPGYADSKALGAAERAARAVADVLGWDEARIATEVERYRDFVRRYHQPVEGQRGGA
jgi:glycerol-3-phosphate dehydrogenase